jgi:hypothetical protein
MQSSNKRNSVFKNWSLTVMMTFALVEYFVGPE